MGDRFDKITDVDELRKEIRSYYAAYDNEKTEHRNTKMLLKEATFKLKEFRTNVPKIGRPKLPKSNEAKRDKFGSEIVSNPEDYILLDEGVLSLKGDIDIKLSELGGDEIQRMLVFVSGSGIKGNKIGDRRLRLRSSYSNRVLTLIRQFDVIGDRVTHPVLGNYRFNRTIRNYIKQYLHDRENSSYYTEREPNYIRDGIAHYIKRNNKV